jgi:hypothetical protein
MKLPSEAGPRPDILTDAVSMGRALPDVCTGNA